MKKWKCNGNRRSLPVQVASESERTCTLDSCEALSREFWPGFYVPCDRQRRSDKPIQRRVRPRPFGHPVPDPRDPWARRRRLPVLRLRLGASSRYWPSARPSTWLSPPAWPWEPVAGVVTSSSDNTVKTVEKLLASSFGSFHWTFYPEWWQRKLSLAPTYIKIMPANISLIKWKTTWGNCWVFSASWHTNVTKSERVSWPFSGYLTTPAAPGCSGW